MSERIEFTRNYNDLCSTQGFQFEFNCDRCGTGYRTHFKSWTVGAVSGVVDTANSLFGGIFGKAADVTERVRTAAWEKVHDQALTEAMEELRPDFFQCPKCSSWVCKKSCWNNRRGLCKNCAPDEGVEMAAAQAARTRDKIWEAADVAAEDKPLTEAKSFEKKLQAGCPNCHAPLPPNVKFCPECGAKLAVESKCAKCGAKLAPGVKFCPECGTKAG